MVVVSPKLSLLHKGQGWGGKEGGREWRGHCIQCAWLHSNPTCKLIINTRGEGEVEWGVIVREEGEVEWGVIVREEGELEWGLIVRGGRE